MDDLSAVLVWLKSDARICQTQRAVQKRAPHLPLPAPGTLAVIPNLLSTPLKQLRQSSGPS